MLSSLFRKKVLSDKVASFFVSSTLEAVEVAFPEFLVLIENEPSFVSRPTISNNQFDKFFFAVLAGNIELLSKKTSEGFNYLKVYDKIVYDVAQIYGKDEATIDKLLSHYHNYLKKINYPSKNVVYGMSKTVFFKYDLVGHQEEFFREMNNPNPIFLNKVNKIMESFIWDWDGVEKRYKVV